MSGGPQVFLGTTTFCMISGCRQISDRREACPPASLGSRAALGASSRSPARPRSPCGGLQSGGARHAPARPRSPCGGLQSGGARHAPARPRRRPRAPQPGPLGLVMMGYSTMSHVIPLRVFHTLKLHRWNCNVLRGARILTVGNYVRLLFWLTSWPRRTDNETPLNNDAVWGLALTVIRSPSASSLPGPRTRRSLPRRRWGGSNRADLLEAGSP